MRNTTRRLTLAGLAILGSSAMLAACAAPPSDTETGAATGEAASDFLPCMVSDFGGFEDRSFNQLGLEGLTAASDSIGVEPITVQSDAETDYAPNINELVSQGCNIIVTVGFALSAATLEAAEANPEVEFALIDDAADGDFDGTVDFENTKPIIFDTAQAAFLAGFAAASYSTTGIVATWGGQNFPTVTIFMDGFAQGVAYYNEQNGTDVQVLGYDPASPDTATFTGGFEANETARTVAQGFIDQNADVLLPVGGPIFQSAAAAIQDSGKDIVMIGVDADLTETAPEYADLFLTSILKQIATATEEVVVAAADGDFSNEPYVGTLENDGVGLAPFHSFEDAVDPELQSQIDELTQQIIDGEIVVTSYLS